MGARRKIFRGRGGSGRGAGAAVLRGLSEDELKELRDRLTLFAANRYRGRPDARDLAMQAMTDVLAGRRGWNTEYTPLQNLCLIVKSIASNRLARESRETSLDPAAPSASPSPADDYETAETQLRIQNALLRVAGLDPLWGRLLALALDSGRWKPAELAAELHIREAEVYEAGRRIRRRLMRVLDKQ